MALSRRTSFQCISCGRNQTRSVGRAGNYVTCKHCGTVNPGPAMVALLFKRVGGPSSAAPVVEPPSQPGSHPAPAPSPAPAPEPAPEPRAEPVAAAPAPEPAAVTPAEVEPHREGPPQRRHFLHRPLFAKT